MSESKPDNSTLKVPKIVNLGSLVPTDHSTGQLNGMPGFDQIENLAVLEEMAKEKISDIRS